MAIRRVDHVPYRLGSPLRRNAAGPMFGSRVKIRLLMAMVMGLAGGAVTSKMLYSLGPGGKAAWIVGTPVPLCAQSHH